MTQEAESAAVFRWPVRVYYEDTDAAGVVFYANYLRFMERARTEWLRALGYDQQRLRQSHGILFVARKAAIRFLQPARLDDLLTVTARLSGHGRAGIDFRQEVVRDRDGAVCCRGDVNIACVDTERMRPVRIPEVLLMEMVDGL